MESSKDFQSLDVQSQEEEIDSGAGNGESLDKDISQYNEATRHLELYNNAWKQIYELEGHTEIVTSANDGSITWKVIKEFTDDELKASRERDEELFKAKDFPIIQSLTYEERNKCDYKTGFWKLWPGTIEGDVHLINNSIEKENIRRKEKYQRTIKKISTNEFIMFNALLIASTVYNDRGCNLWADNCDMKKKAGVSINVNFGIYMKLWRFKQIKQFISTLMKEEEVKKDDSWWKVKGIINKFIEKRKEVIIASHTLVFDESMSAFVPR